MEDYGGLDWADAREHHDEMYPPGPNHYEEGLLAYGRNLHLADNPHRDGTIPADLWEDGWYDARRRRTGRTFQ